MLKSFKTAIDERNSEQETLIIDLKSIKENKITKAKITKSSIKLNVSLKLSKLERYWTKMIK